MAMPWQIDEADYDLGTTKYSPEWVDRWKYIQSPTPGLRAGSGVDYMPLDLLDEQFGGEREALFQALYGQASKTRGALAGRPYAAGSKKNRAVVPGLGFSQDEINTLKNQAQEAALTRSDARDMKYYDEQDKRFRNPDGSWNEDAIAAANARDAFNNFPGMVKQHIAPGGEVRWGGEIPGGGTKDLMPLDREDRVETPRDWLRPTAELESMGPGARDEVLAERKSVSDWLNQRIAALLDTAATTKGKQPANTSELPSLQRALSTLGMSPYAYKDPKQREQEEKDRVVRFKDVAERMRMALMKLDEKTGKPRWSQWDVENVINAMMKAGGPTEKVPEDMLAALPEDLRSVSRPPAPTPPIPRWLQPGYGGAPMPTEPAKPVPAPTVIERLAKLLEAPQPTTPNERPTLPKPTTGATPPLYPQGGYREGFDPIAAIIGWLLNTPNTPYYPEPKRPFTTW